MSSRFLRPALPNSPQTGPWRSSAVAVSSHCELCAPSAVHERQGWRHRAYWCELAGNTARRRPLELVPRPRAPTSPPNRRGSAYFFAPKHAGTRRAAAQTSSWLSARRQQKQRRPPVSTKTTTQDKGGRQDDKKKEEEEEAGAEGNSQLLLLLASLVSLAVAIAPRWHVVRLALAVELRASSRTGPSARRTTLAWSLLAMAAALLVDIANAALWVVAGAVVVVPVLAYLAACLSGGPGESVYDLVPRVRGWANT